MDQKARLEPKDQWEKKLREKLMDYQAPIDQLPPLQLPKAQRKKPILWLMWSGIAAAAVIALLLLLNQKSTPIIMPTQYAEFVAEQIEPVESIAQVDQLVAHNSKPYSLPKYPIDNEVTITEEAPTTMQEGEEPQTISETKTEEVSDYLPVEEQPSKKNIVIQPKQKDPVKLSINVGGVSPVRSGLVATPDQFSLVSVTDSRYFEPPKEQFFTKEMVPLEVAVTAIVPLSKKWSIESGVQYAHRQLSVTSNLGSEFRAKVHAVGVPINLQYYFASIGQWHCYGSAGASAMFPITVVYKGDGVKRLKQKLYLDTHLSLGAEYKISKSTGIYGAIGGGYDLIPLDQELFATTNSRWHLKLSAGVRFEIK